MRRPLVRIIVAFSAALASAVAFACGGDDVIVPLERDGRDASVDATIANDANGDSSPSDAGADALDASFDGTLPPRCLPDTLDQSFGEGGIVVLPVMDSVAAVAHQSDGKIVALGTNAQGMVLARLLADGTLDPTFGVSGVTTILADKSTALSVGRDDAIVAGGQHGTLARFLPNGLLDPGFGNGGIQTLGFPIMSIAFDAVGGLYVAGVDTVEAHMARCNADGHIDKGFGKNGIVEEVATCPASGGFKSVRIAVEQSGVILWIEVQGCEGASASVMRTFAQDGGALSDPFEIKPTVADFTLDRLGRCVAIVDGMEISRPCSGPAGGARPSFDASFVKPIAVFVTPHGDIVGTGGGFQPYASPIVPSDGGGVAIEAVNDDGKLVAELGNGGAQFIPLPGFSVPSSASLQSCDLAVTGFAPGLSVARFVSAQ